MERATFLPAPHVFNLNQACAVVAQALNHSVYLVGSALERRDYRDVDVRAILDDAEFDRLFPGLAKGIASLDPLWSLMCSSISLYLQQHSGLPVDFQIQRSSDANAKYQGRRHALGMFYRPGMFAGARRSAPFCITTPIALRTAGCLPTTSRA